MNQDRAGARARLGSQDPTAKMDAMVTGAFPGCQGHQDPLVTLGFLALQGHRATTVLKALGVCAATLGGRESPAPPASQGLEDMMLKLQVATLARPTASRMS